MIFPWKRTQQTVPSRPIYGVNLGSWLVLEKWITPSLFRGTACIDEHSLFEAADSKTLDRIRQHHEAFITKADFTWLKVHGIDAVRLPLGYGVFGDAKPYPSTIEFVDKAFEWASRNGLKVLLDLHTAPGSQNGFQESGQAGKVRWHTDEQNIIRSLRVIEGLAKRYSGHTALLGIELLNEPHSKIPRRKLLKYYEAAYKIIRHECGAETWVVFSDNFKPRRWKRKLRTPRYENMFIDTHQYQTYTAGDKRLDIRGHLRKTLGKIPKNLEKMQKYHPVIVGEWSIVLNDKSLRNLNKLQIRAAKSAYGDAQLIAFEHTSAWFYWTYRTEDGGAWSFRDCLEQGWLTRLK